LFVEWADAADGLKVYGWKFSGRNRKMKVAKRRRKKSRWRIDEQVMNAGRQYEVM